VYSIQHYVIKFVSDLRLVSGFLRILWFPPPKKSSRHDIAEILLKVALNTITQTLKFKKFPDSVIGNSRVIYEPSSAHLESTLSGLTLPTKYTPENKRHCICRTKNIIFYYF
jgi:hypothetical protein